MKPAAICSAPLTPQSTATGAPWTGVQPGSAAPAEAATGAHSDRQQRERRRRGRTRAGASACGRQMARTSPTGRAWASSQRAAPYDRVTRCAPVPPARPASAGSPRCHLGSVVPVPAGPRWLSADGRPLFKCCDACVGRLGYGPSWRPLPAPEPAASRRRDGCSCRREPAASRRLLLPPSRRQMERAPVSRGPLLLVVSRLLLDRTYARP